MVVRKRLELLKWTSHLWSRPVYGPCSAAEEVGEVGLNSITLHILQDNSTVVVVHGIYVR
jgi:hypothetical protein